MAKTPAPSIEPSPSTTASARPSRRANPGPESGWGGVTPSDGIGNRRRPSPSYDVCMKKRRVTLNLDEDVVEALEAVGGRSMSSVANDALREALEVAAHRAALREWLDELDDKHGAPSPEELAAAKDLLDAVKHGEIDGTSAA
ncbi:MAG: BrnA antitoxin family protein [Pseudonocardiaceae bacterium]